MSGILVIASDRKRHNLVRALIRDHPRRELAIVDSVDAAIADFEKYQPDVILTPTLLPREESDRLCAHVKRHADPHVQMLSLPALDLLREPKVEEHPRFWFLWRRRPSDPELLYDPALIYRQISECVERARLMRSEQPADRNRRLILMPDEANDLHSVRPMKTTGPRLPIPERRGDHRIPQRSPWPWIVHLPGGASADLVNISSGGILFESRSLVSPGVTLDLQVSSAGVSCVVPARFVRSAVAGADGLGSRYYSAARFEQPLEIPGLGVHTALVPRATPQSLAELFTSVVSDSRQLEPCSTRFARGLRALVGARDVVIATSPLAPSDDTESVYFSVKWDAFSNTILQVVFDRHRALTSAEHALLKAAAAMTTAVLELEPACNQEQRVTRVA